MERTGVSSCPEEDSQDTHSCGGGSMSFETVDEGFP
jgi:hypothetical protein